jgi:hypothetical protein
MHFTPKLKPTNNMEDIKDAIIEMCDAKVHDEYKNNLRNFKWKQNWETLFNQYEEIVNVNSN